MGCVMKNVYEQTEIGWKLVFKAKSFNHACRVCAQHFRQTAWN